MTLDANDKPRFTTVTPLDHSAGLWIATILSLVYATLILLARLLVSRLQRRRLGRSDIVLVSSYLLAAGNYALMFAALTNGAGKARQSLELGIYNLAVKASLPSIIYICLDICLNAIRYDQSIADKQVISLACLLCDCPSFPWVRFGNLLPALPARSHRRRRHRQARLLGSHNRLSYPHDH